MKFIVAIVFVFSAAMYLASANSLTEVINEVIADTDKDGNGFIDETEFNTELLRRWSTDNTSDSLSKTDFVNHWTAEYKDNRADAAAFFDNLDKIFLPPGLLTSFDLLFHLATLDPDGDHRVSVADFATFIRENHPCGQAGHLHC